jgi:MFS family permease
MNTNNSFTMYKQALIPIISFAIIMLGQGFFNTFVSINLLTIGFSTSLIAVITSFYFVGLVLASLSIDKFIGRIGHIRSFILFAAVNAICTIILGMTTNTWGWIGIRLLMGACAAGLFITLQSWLLLLSTPLTKGKLLSLYMISLYAAQGAGQFILNFIDLNGHVPFLIFIVSALVSIAPLCLMKTPSFQIKSQSPIANIGPIFKITPFGVLGCIIAGMIVNAFTSLGPIFAKELHLSIWQVSQVMGLSILGGLSLQWPIGHLADLFGRLKVLLIVTFILLMICTTLYMSPFLPYWSLLLLSVLFGAFAFTLYPLSISYTCDYFSTEKIVPITCSLLVIYGIGSILGPLAGSIPMQYLQPSGLFLCTGILSLILMIGGLSKMAQKALPLKENSDKEQI